MRGIMVVGKVSLLLLLLVLFPSITPAVYGMAADCALQPTGENYIGVKYKAFLAEDELSSTGWVLLFGGNGFTRNGEYQPHFMDLMIKAWWADIYDDPLCSSGFPPREIRRSFSIEFGISDYEDGTTQDNDIAAWSRDPQLFPRMFTNIDSSDPNAPDKIMTVYQIDQGGTLEGREIEVSFVREEVTTLPRDKNYFMDPDNSCKPNSQADILYRHWVVRLAVPSLHIDSSVDFYINADQGDKLIGTNTLNFMWENYGRPVVESDKFKVILFDMEVKTVAGEWRKASKFFIDIRTPNSELPLNSSGELLGGYRKTYYEGRPALEMSFGYGLNDYVKDGNPNGYEQNEATKALIDLSVDERPDLIVSDISWNPVIPKIGEIVDFRIDITNQGTIAADSWAPFDVQYYVDDVNMGKWTIDSLKEGETIFRQFSWTGTEGVHTVRACSDQGGSVPETDENNNCKEETINVSSSPSNQDLNGDGIVNILDITIVAAAYNTKAGDPKWNELADLDKNGQVNILDVTMVAKDYGKTV